jgi:trimeric autotransporter adhesin
MSTKTVTKRVALATVVALGAGVLSLVSVTSSTAATTNVAIASPSNVSAIATGGSMNIGTATNTTGAVVQPSTNNATTWASLNLLQVSNTAATTAADNSQTAVLGTGGKLLVYTATTSQTGITVFSVTNGTLSLAAITSDSAFISTAYNNAGTTVAIGNTNTGYGSTTVASSVVATPTNSALPMVVTGYNATTSGSSVVAADVVKAMNGTYTLTQIGQVTVTVSSSSVAGTLSLTNSKPIYTGTGGGVTALSNPVDYTSGNPATANYPAIGTSAWNKAQYGSLILKDAYGVLVAGGGVVTATTTNGAYVAFSAAANGSATPPTSAGTASVAYTTTTSGQASIGFTVGTANASGLTTTVTFSYNGVTVGVLAFTFVGDVAKVVLSAPSNGLNGSSASATQNVFTIAASDAAGNRIAVKAGTSYPENYSSIAANTQGLGIGLDTVYYNTTQSATVTQTGSFKCSATTAAVGSIQLQYVNADGVTVQSNVLALSCSGNPYTYSASFDKTSYNPGDLATLTVTFKDAAGSLAGDNATSVISTSGKLPTVTGAFLSPANGNTSNAASATVGADNTTNGVAVYKFIVGSTSGSYRAVVDYPALDANTVATAQSVAYTINSTGTSLNDVLKGIVSLIASINKQIAALAKLVTKK